MKLLSTLLSLFLITTFSAQVLNHKDSIQHFRIALGVDAWNSLRLIRGHQEAVPINFEAQYFVKKNISFGASFGVSRTGNTKKVLYEVTPDSVNYAYYTGKVLNTEYLLRGNYFFTFPNTESKFLQNWRIYTALGIGLGIEKNQLKIDQETPTLADNIKEVNYYFAKQISVGMEYKFKCNLGVYFETGFAMATTQFGVLYKF